MLFFFLIGTCLSINQDSLQPISSNHPSTGLISIAKLNPHALVEMLDGADPSAINDIVEILRSLIQDGVDESSQLNETVRTVTDHRDNMIVEVRRLNVAAGAAQNALNRRAKTEAEKKGVRDAKFNTMEGARPGFEKELSTLQKVYNMLQKLLKESSIEKQDLIEIGSSQRGKAYLQLIANVQANPEKVSKVIGFVKTMMDNVNSSFAILKQDVVKAEEDLGEAVKLREKAEVTWVSAVDAAKRGLHQLDEAKGALTAAVQARDTRLPVLRTESATLQEVIDLLLTTSDSPTTTVIPSD